MIVVKVELWPHGDARKAKELTRMAIANDASGDSLYGNYDVVVHNNQQFRKGVWRTGQVKGHDRSISPWYLVRSALDSALPASVRGGVANASLSEERATALFVGSLD